MGMFWASCQNHSSGGPVDPTPADYISRWLMSADVAGQIIDDKGLHNLNLRNGATIAPGHGDYTLHLDRSQSQNASTPGNSCQSTYLTPAFSISMWIKPTAAALSNGGWIVSNNYQAGGSGSGNNAGAYMSVTSTGVARCGYCVRNKETFTDSNGTTVTTYGISVSSIITLTPDIWAHICGVWDQAAKTCWLYINGALAGSVTSVGEPQFKRSASGSAAGAQSYSVGKLHYVDYGSSFHPFDGEINDVIHYSRVLTEAEIIILAGSR